MFNNRVHAGRLLAERLSAFARRDDCVVIGLPRGGVVCAAEVAYALDLPLDIVVPRKIGAPGNPEFAIGAVSEEGERVIDEQTIRDLNISTSYIEAEVDKEMREATRRLRVYRGDRPSLDLQGKTAILVDDGIATGATMLAAIASARAKQAERVVVAVPVCPPDSLKKVADRADDVICLETQDFFAGVGMFYHSFEQVEDHEVVAIMQPAT